METQLTVKPKQLTIEDIQTLPVPLRIEDGLLILEKSLRGWSLKEAVKIPLNMVLGVREKGLVTYIFTAFSSERPKLLPFVFENHSLVKLARHFLRHCSGSPATLYSYVDTVSRYSHFLDHSPDIIIQDVKSSENLPDPVKVQSHIGFLEDYLANLQDEGLTPGRVHSAIKHVKTFYRVNGIEIKLTEPLSRRITFKDRSPTPEELARLLEIGDLRAKTVVALLALGGFREGTVAKLKYRHVRGDLEKDIAPIHVHVEPDITKGRYCDYDSFIGAEAAEYLKLYMDQRRRGSPDGRAPPEELTDNSPLIRDQTSHTPRPIGSKQIRKLVHNLYMKAGLVKAPRGRMYDLRVHSLRKFFKTQLLALGVQPDYVSYMMGHSVNVYHDIQMKGVEFLRGIYAATGLSIKPKTKVSKMEALKEIIRAWGMNPEQILTREALSQEAATYVNPEDRENYDLQILSRALKDLIRQEIVKD